MNLKQIIPTLAATVFCCTSFAQNPDNSSARKHIIIAFDEAGTDKWRGTDNEVRTYVYNLLFENEGKEFLSDNDYFSVVGVKASPDPRRWEDFIYVKEHRVNSNMLSLAYCQDADLAKKIIGNASSWADLATCRLPAETGCYSLLSVANPYILRKLGTRDEKELVESTYIIFITDDRYGGDDYFREFQYFLGQESFAASRINVNTALETCYEIGQEYSIIFKKQKDNRTVGYQHNVELFEVKANQDYLTLPAVISYSPTLIAKRHKGGTYSLNLSLKHSNDHFEIKEVKIFTVDSDSAAKLYDSIVTSEYVQEIEFAANDGIRSIRLEAKLKLNDGLYDATLLTPAFFKGLTQDIPIEYEKPAKFLFGLCVLPDCLWIRGIENQTSAAIVLDFIILFAALAAFVAYLLLTNTYVPKNEDVSICTYDNKQ